MFRVAASQIVAAAVLLLGGSTLPAQAALHRTFVSGVGTDTGTCARTAPCQTFQFAHDQTAAGGEIEVLDAGDYGPVTITKAISIIQDGAGEAGVSGSITINAGPSDNISLRGLNLNGGGTAGFGIVFNTGGSLSVLNCIVRNYSGHGMLIAPSNDLILTVSHTLVENNALEGIVIDNGSGSPAVTGTIDHVASNNNGLDGIYVLVQGPGTAVSILDSIFNFNSRDGIVNAYDGKVIIRNTVSSNNMRNGLAGQSPMYFAHSTVTGNLVGVKVYVAGVVHTYGDNNIDGNVTDIDGTLIPVAEQ